MMKPQRKSILYILFTLLLAFWANQGIAQDKKVKPGKKVKTEKQMDAFIELQDDRDKAHAEKMEEKRKKHRDIQTKETQKRMKRNKKKAARIQKNKHQDTFLQRLFKKKPKGR
jgi:hypothetical protein